MANMILNVSGGIYRLVWESDTEILLNSVGIEVPGVECVTIEQVDAEANKMQLVRLMFQITKTQFRIMFEDGREVLCDWPEWIGGDERFGGNKFKKVL
jgi:hypothetical protein